MATIEPSYGTIVALTVTNLHSLADASFWQSASVDNNVDKAVWIEVFVTLQTTTTAGSATGYANIYLAESPDGGTDFSGNASGTEGSYAPAPSAGENSKNLRPLGQIAMKADETTARTYRKNFVLAPFTVPKSYSIVIENRTGAALNSAGNAVEILKNKVTST